MENKKEIVIMGFGPKTKRAWITEFILPLIAGIVAGVVICSIIKFFAG